MTLPLAPTLPLALALGLALGLTGCAETASPAAGGSAAPRSATPRSATPRPAGLPETAKAPPEAWATTVPPVPPPVPLSRPDLSGRGQGWQKLPEPRGQAEPPWPSAMRQCVLYDPAEYPAQRQRIGARRHVYAHGDRRVTVVVERFRPGWGQRSLADVRAVVDACVRYEYTDRDEDFLESHRIVAERFTAHEAVLVETVRIQPPTTRVRWTAVLRRGDLVATVSGAGVPEREVRRLAALVGSRLR